MYDMKRSDMFQQHVQHLQGESTFVYEFMLSFVVRHRPQLEALWSLCGPCSCSAGLGCVPLTENYDQDLFLHTAPPETTDANYSPGEIFIREDFHITALFLIHSYWLHCGKKCILQHRLSVYRKNLPVKPTHTYGPNLCTSSHTQIRSVGVSFIFYES